MKKVYVDTENIATYNFLKKMGLTEEDEIILFLSKRSNHINPMNLDILLNCKAMKKTVFVEAEEKNAMDFQIVTYLGLVYSKENSYYIVSNDKGYSSAVDCFVKQFGYTNVYLLTEKISVNDVKDVKDERIVGKEAIPVIENIERSYGIGKKKVIDLIKKADDCRKLHNDLVREYGQQGKEMYQLFKKAYKLIL